MLAHAMATNIELNPSDLPSADRHRRPNRVSQPNAKPEASRVSRVSRVSRNNQTQLTIATAGPSAVAVTGLGLTPLNLTQPPTLQPTLSPSKWQQLQNAIPGTARQASPKHSPLHGATASSTPLVDRTHSLSTTSAGTTPGTVAIPATLRKGSGPVITLPAPNAGGASPLLTPAESTPKYGPHTPTSAVESTATIAVTAPAPPGLVPSSDTGVGGNNSLT